MSRSRRSTPLARYSRPRPTISVAARLGSAGSPAGRCTTFQAPPADRAHGLDRFGAVDWTTSGSTAAVIAARSAGEASTVTATTSGRRSAGAADRISRDRSAASSRRSSRGVPAARLSPIASAPAATAASTPAASVTPQILTNGRRATLAGSSGARPAATNAAAVAAGVAERTRASPTSAASKPRARQRATVAGSRTPDSAMTRRSSGTSSRSRAARSRSTSSVRRSRLLRPMTRAALSSARSSSRLVMDLDQRLHPELEGPRDESRQPARRMEHREQEHEIGAGRAKHRQLAFVDDELLGEDRNADHGPDRSQVVDRPAEPVGLAQDGDRCRAAGLVRPGARDQVVTRPGDPARRW